MQMISGGLYRGEHRVAAVPIRKIVNNGWGEIGSRHIVLGDPFWPVPDRLSLAWFSYAEDQFFGGSVALPRAELIDLFRAGLEEPVTGESVTWNKIIVGMGLGGWTSVWLSRSGIVREVARGRVEPTEIDWIHVLDNPNIQRSDFVRSRLQSRLGDVALDHLTEHGPPVSTWTRYAQRYRWRILVEGVHAPLDMFLRSFNGERSYYEFAKQPPEELAIAPKHLQITWRERGGGRLLTRIRLDEQEVFAAFDEASAAAPAPSTIMLRVAFTSRTRVALSVESGAGELQLTRSNIEVRTLVG
jgi:hypothetical protein